tara:strand:- start:23514 stop:23771 length:258 start_codon:yes stop_codon:yes gene_type:complete
VTLDELRTERDALLSASDYAVLPDVPYSLSPAQRENVVIYRQSLRDITMQWKSTKTTIEWPKVPFELGGNPLEGIDPPEDMGDGE